MISANITIPGPFDLDVFLEVNPEVNHALTGYSVVAGRTPLKVVFQSEADFDAFLSNNPSIKVLFSNLPSGLQRGQTRRHEIIDSVITRVIEGTPAHTPDLVTLQLTLPDKIVDDVLVPRDLNVDGDIHQWAGWSSSIFV